MPDTTGRSIGLSDTDARSVFENSLSEGKVSFGQALEVIRSNRRLDLTELPLGSAAWLLSQASKRMVWIVPSEAAAAQCRHNVSFFSSDPADHDAVLAYPAPEITPFVDMVSDRRHAMHRLRTLATLAHDWPWRHLVVPAAALLRRVPPKHCLRENSITVLAEEAVDRDVLLRLLNESGYARVPVVEDPGSYSVRGAIIDVFSPRYAVPVRIELDDYLVLSLKSFDPDTQRSLNDLREFQIVPVRELIINESVLQTAVSLIRHHCDAIDLPTSQTRQLIDLIQSGRNYPGMEGFLPAYHPSLETLFDYLPQDCRLVVVDPPGVIAAVESELQQAEKDLAAKVEDQRPVFPINALYLADNSALTMVAARAPIVIHDLAVSGEDSEGDLQAVGTDVLRMGCVDHRQLRATLNASREVKGKHDTLKPMAKELIRWQDEGYRILLTNRTTVQAERFRHLLKDHGVTATTDYATVPSELVRKLKPADIVLNIGELANGFVCTSEALVCLTEEEVFGARRHQSPRRKGDAKHPFLRDLRSLTAGDYIVHPEHGIGRYLGLERKELPISKLDQLRGVTPAILEVLVVEYAEGAKLYLPVTRLNQIQKFSDKDTSKPKLDRLGGQSFSRTKAKVRQAVRQLADQLLALYAQRAAREKEPLSAPDGGYEAFEAEFHFEETPDQARAINDVLHDLNRPTPMDRVVCGDVGFGKTEVAIRAAFRTAMAGRQVALLCPTTVLAQQHYLNFRDRFKNYPIQINVLSRFVPKQEQPAILARLKEGSCDIVIGTHRLLSKDVHFKRLGLLVVDEEQRFGVTHKERIKQLRADIDVLTLTATPIPRTLQMAIGGLRDLSLITTPPADRRAVRTFITRWNDHVIREALRREFARGGQVFFVYNRVEGLYERAQRIAELIPEARVAVAHAQMKESALESVMTDFVNGGSDILCSTAIIESGLDIPRANTIIIDGAELLGLSQLYQLRGRVGRSKERAYCYLVVPPPSSLSEDARSRIEVLERFSHLGAGFHVASLDMDQRGAGDLLGAEQSGHVAAVGFDLFVHMLEEAVAQLRGQPLEPDIDPELTLDVEQRLPDDYIDDIGVRLSFYQRLAAASDDDSIQELAKEMEERFGPPPHLALQCIRVMALKPTLRELRALGLEGSRRRVTLHLSKDTPLSATAVTKLVSRVASGWEITPDMKLTRRFDEEEIEKRGTLELVEEVLKELSALKT